MCREAVGQRNIQNLVQNITIQQKVIMWLTTTYKLTMIISELIVVRDKSLFTVVHNQISEIVYFQQ